MLANILYLSMTIMTRDNNIGHAGGHDLVKFYPPIGLPLIGKSCLQCRRLQQVPIQ
jgi:hypothetical protein